MAAMRLTLNGTARQPLVHSDSNPALGGRGQECLEHRRLLAMVESD
jgi:hypothetical protein